MGRGLRSITALTIVVQAGCQFYMDGGASVQRNHGAVRVEGQSEAIADDGAGRELSTSRYILDLGGYTRLGDLPLRIMTGLWSSMDQMTFRESDTMGNASVRSSWEVASIATVGVNLPIVRFMGHQLAPYGFYGHSWLPTYLQAPAVSTHLEVGVEVCGNQVEEEESDGFFDSFCLRGGMARSGGRPPNGSIGVEGSYEVQGVFFMMGFRTMEIFPVMRAVIVAALLVAAAGSARGDSSEGARSSGTTSVYGLGAGAGWGRAMLRPTSDPASITYIRYTELNGIVAKFLILIGAAPQQPTVTVSNVSSSESCDGTYCTTTTTWTETEPTEADWLQYEKDVQAYSAHAAAVMAGAVPLEFTFDLALKSLGGDAGGFSTELLWREPFTGFLGMRLAEFAFGLNWTRFYYSDVMREQAAYVDDATIAISEVAASTTYSSFGFPVRFMVFPFPRLALYTRLDLNMMAMVGALIDSVDDEGALKTTYHPNLMHGGAILYLGIAYLRADVAIDGGDVESLMYTGELGLQF